jgi:hypothetical protein
MDAAEVKRLADQEACRTKQRVKYEQAGAAELMKKAEDSARSEKNMRAQYVGETQIMEASLMYGGAVPGGAC